MTMPAPVKLRSAADAVYGPLVALDRALTAVGNNTTASLLGVSKSQPGRWRSRQEQMSAVNASAIVALDAFLSLVLQVFTREQATLWLVGSEPFLGGARPVDVFRLRGLAGVLPALQAVEQGAFA